MKNGFLIPFHESWKQIKQDKILLEVEEIGLVRLEEGYAVLDEMVGFCESNRFDASEKS